MSGLNYFASVLVGDELYVSSNKVPALYKIDLNNASTEKVLDFISRKNGNDNTHFSAFGDDKFIYFLPGNGKSIDCYNKKTGDLLIINDDYLAEYDAIGACKFENNIFVFPRHYKRCVLVIDSVTNKIIQKIDVQDNSASGDKETKCLKMCKRDNRVFLPIVDTKKIECFDLEKKTTSVHTLNIEDRFNGEIIAIENQVFIATASGIAIWNESNNIMKQIKVNFDDKNNYVEKMIHYGNKMIMVPHFWGNVKILTLNSLEIQDIEIDKSKLHINVENPWRDTKDALLWKNKLLITPVKYAETVIIDLENDSVSYVQYNVAIDYSTINGNIIQEGYGDLKDWINWLSVD